ncbi:MAG: hypothetical protein ACTSRI_06935 [Promethearchaeota archaeon]
MKCFLEKNTRMFFGGGTSVAPQFYGSLKKKVYSYCCYSRSSWIGIDTPAEFLMLGKFIITKNS